MKIDRAIKQWEQITLYRERGVTFRAVAKKLKLPMNRVCGVVAMGKPKHSLCDACKKPRNDTRYHRFCVDCSKVLKGTGNGRELTRMMARIRDNFTCQDCGAVRTPREVFKNNAKKKTLKGRIKLFDVHHTNGDCGKKSRGYDSVEDLSILVTLCHKCHFNRPEHATKRNSIKDNQTPVLVEGYREPYFDP